LAKGLNKVSTKGLIEQGIIKVTSKGNSKVIQEQINFTVYALSQLRELKKLEINFSGSFFVRLVKTKKMIYNIFIRKTNSNLLNWRKFYEKKN